jgi:hypothetical protein
MPLGITVEKQELCAFSNAAEMSYLGLSKIYEIYVGTKGSI